jgi:CheY-like chemotaxis protein
MAPVLEGPSRVVLLVDDEPDFRLMTRVLLEKHDFQVIEADNGADALDHLSRHQVSVVITDLYMPSMGGIDLIRHLRQHRPDISSIVAVTGKWHLRSEARALAASVGAHNVLMKPFSLQELLVALEHGA